MSTLVPPEGFRTFPSLFLQAGYPLKVSIYLLDPKVSSEPTVFRSKGEVLEIDEMMNLNKMRVGQVLARSDEAEQALEFYRDDPLYDVCYSK